MVLMSCWTGMLSAAPVDRVAIESAGEGPWIVRAYTLDRSTVDAIRTVTEPWGRNLEEGYVVLEVTDHSQYRQLRDLGLDLHVDLPLTEQYFRQALRSTQGSTTIPGFDCYSTVEHTYQRMDDLAAARPDLATIIDIGDSWEKINLAAGFDLRVIRITNSAIPGPKPKLFAMGSIHAREYTPAELVARFAEQLVNQYGVDPDVTWIVDHHEVHLLTPGNPDGRKQAETGISWRKTTNQAYCSPTSNNRGADINRNFPFKHGGTGSSGNECGETYRGPSPASESETQAINNYIASIFPDQRGPADGDAAPDDATGVYLDVHSFSEVVLWPWGWGAPGVSPNNAQLRTLGRRFAFYNGYFPQPSDDFGAAAGASDDNAYGSLGIAAYTFELGTTFFQSCAVFENEILPGNLPALLYAAKVARTPYLTAGGPDVITPSLSSTLVVAGETVTLSASVTDTRFSSRNGTEPTQAISGADLYIDVPPWQSGATPLALTAVDGAFDSTTEAVELTLDTTALASGRHQLFIQGSDASGLSGAISSVFLEVINEGDAGRIQGRVTDLITGLPIEAATVTAQPFTGSSDASGDFDLLVIPDSYTLDVSATGYESTAIAGVTVTMGNSTTQNVALQPICQYFADDLESGPGDWVAEANWAISDEQSVSPTHAWSDSPGGNHGNNRNQLLSSPVIDLSNATGSELRFQSRCMTEATFDFGRVEIGTLGGSFTEIYACDGSNPWQEVILDVSAFDGQPEVVVRFRFESDGSVTDDGWHIDDIAIRADNSSCDFGLPDALFEDGFESP